MKTAVILVTTTAADSFRRCLDALQSTLSKQDADLYIVANGCALPDVESATVHRLPERVCYAAAVNAAVRRISADLLIFLHDDVVLVAGWLEEFQRLFREHSDLALLGPRTNWARRDQIDAAAAYDSPAAFEQYAASKLQNFTGQWTETVCLDGCCMAVRGESFNEIGGLDERFAPGYGETLDYCHRVQRIGLKIGVAESVYVHHAGGATLADAGADTLHPATEAMQQLREKWQTDVAGADELPVPPVDVDTLEWGTPLLCTQPDAQHVLQAGIELAQREEYPAAVRHIQRALWLQPDDNDILLNLGALFVQIGQTEPARKLIDQVITRESRKAEAHFTLGLLEMQEQRWEHALESFRTTIACNVYLEPAYEQYRLAAEQLGRRVDGDVTDFVFYTTGIRFDGSTIHTRGLGGSESALYYMARGLAARGYSVRVFNKCETPGIYDNVEYADLVDYYLFRKFNRCRVFISSRSFTPFYDPPPADRMALWLHDTPAVWHFEEEDPSKIDFSRVLILTLSEWHTGEWMQALSLGRENFYITRNGYDHTVFEDLPTQRDRYKLLYTSRPIRGLEPLLDMFPRIRERLPQAHLHVYTYALSKKDREIEAFIHKAEQPGVHLHDPIGKRALAEEMATAGLLTYPSIFKETSCISAIEAQAAGLPIVSTALAALKETVAHNETGILLEGDGRSQEYQDAYVDTVVRLIEDNAEWQRLSDNGKRRAFSEYTWDRVADDWAALFQPWLAADADKTPDAAKAVASKPRLSVCMIVKNEAETLPTTLASVRPVADEIIIMDTGSTDDTIAVAEQHGAKVLPFAWCNDFSAARNASIDAATGDWILYIDADERLPETEYGKIREVIANPDIMAVNLSLHTPEDAGQVLETTTIDYCRLFRRDSRIRLEGRIHEQVLPSINRIGGRVLRSDIILEHWAYHRSAQKDTERADRNMRMLREILQEDPADVFVRFYYAKTLRLLQRNDDAVREFLQVVREGGGVLKPRLRAEAHTVLGQLYLAIDKPEDARAQCEQSLALDGDAVLTRYVMAAASLELQDPQRALEELQQLLMLSEQDAAMRRQGRLNVARLWLDIGACHYHLEKLEQAADAWKKSTQLDAGNVEAWFNLGVAQMKLGQLSEARQTLLQALSIDPNLAPAKDNLRICDQMLADA